MCFSEYFKKQALSHPTMEPQDAIKLCYQAAFGAEHLLEDAEGAWAYFKEEFAATAKSAVEAQEVPVPLVEPISDDFSRVNLPVWHQQKLPMEWLFQMFLWTAQQKSQGSSSTFQVCLEEVEQLALEGNAPFSFSEWQQFRKDYEKTGVHPVHHSQGYRQSERPAYRIVAQELIRLIPVLEKLAKLPRIGNQAQVVAIDGRAASGKTTLVGQLAFILNGGVVHMDDFFLPQELRTEQRFSEPGGNVHYERFMEEVLPFLSSTEAFTYRRFHCGKMAYDEMPILVPKGDWRMVEGAYSCHPLFGDYMDVRIFVSIQPQLQMERIHVRDGQEASQMFADRWLPFEEAYIAAYAVDKKADILL